MQAALLIAVSLTAAASAADRTWTNGAGGSFHDVANWNGPVPTGADTTIFALDNTYAVTFADSVSTDRVRVDAGLVTFELEPWTYQLLRTNGLVPGVEVGDGLLRIVGGGMNARYAEIAAEADTSGTLRFAGPDASFHALDRVLVGGAGIGLIGADDGAYVRAGRLVLGEEILGVGQASAIGADAWIEVDQQLVAGVQGAALVWITQGGRITCDRAIMGQMAEGFAVALVIGPGSVWAMDGGLDVGFIGRGELEIRAGGRVSTGGFATIGTFGAGGLDDPEGGDGSVLVTGPGSTWDVGGDLHVGYFWEADLRIEAGGHVTCSSGFVTYPNSYTLPDAAVVTGPGSRWDAEESIFIGGRLAITDGGVVSAGMLEVREENIATDDTLLTGDGTIDADLFSEGMIRPGIELDDPPGEASIGTLHVTGDLELRPVDPDAPNDPRSTLVIDVSTPDLPEGHGALAVGGTATLGGVLEVRIVGDPYDFGPGDSFVILTAAAVEGRFDEFIAEPPPNVPDWAVRYEPTRVLIGIAIEGDVNLDGVVDVNDIVQVIQDWGPCPAEGSCDSDTNADGVVDCLDLLFVISRWS